MFLNINYSINNELFHSDTSWDIFLNFSMDWSQNNVETWIVS